MWRVLNFKVLIGHIGSIAKIEITVICYLSGCHGNRQFVVSSFFRRASLGAGSEACPPPQRAVIAGVVQQVPESVSGRAGRRYEGEKLDCPKNMPACI